jgi:signal transduction histidine kinase
MTGHDRTTIERGELDEPPLPESISLRDVGAAIAICTPEGFVVGATAHARALLQRAGVDCEDLPVVLPPGLVAALTATPEGQSNEWRPPAGNLCLGWARYRAGAGLVMLLMREITEMQHELSRRLQQQRLQAIGTIVAGIAHDIRTPLACVVFTARVLQSRLADLTPEERAQSLDTIVDAATRMRETIAGLLDYARLGPPTVSRTRLDEVVSRVCSLLRPLLRDAGHDVATRVAPGISVQGNPLVVEQILVNLVHNATEAANAPLLVQIAASQRDDDVVVDVRDDGPGIPANVRPHVFKPFFTTRADGTGLGLTMAQEAARELGGDLSLLDSDAGAHFQLRLRRASPESAHPALEAPL